MLSNFTSKICQSIILERYFELTKIHEGKIYKATLVAATIYLNDKKWVHHFVCTKFTLAVLSYLCVLFKEIDFTIVMH